MAAPAIAPGRVLLIEADDNSRKEHARALEKGGFDVHEVTNRQAALERLTDSSFELVVADVSMPDAGGLEMIRCLREQAPDVPVILMANRINNETRIAAVELGARFCLAKPITEEEIVRALASVMRSRGKRTPPSPRATTRQWAQTLPSTTVKQSFGRVLDTAIHRGPVLITKHHDPRAVLVSIDAYEELVRSRTSSLVELSDEFDAMLARMQEPDARAVMDAAFNASPEGLGEAAVRQATEGD